MTRTRVALIDGDAAFHTISYWHKEEMIDDKVVRASVDQWIQSILTNSKAAKYCGFYQGAEKSHRHKIFETYKGNRPPAFEWVTRWKPTIIEQLNAWKFQEVNGMETDDAIASSNYLLYKEGYDPIVCSVDKDFNQIPGLHYNPRKQEITDISSEEAYTFFCTQLLTGDSTDNIKGIPGIGPKKAQDILKEAFPILSAMDLMDQVTRAYVKYHGDMQVGILDFAENVIKITLKIDKEFKFTINDLEPPIIEENLLEVK